MPSKIFIPNLDNLLERYQAGESENALAKEAGINRWTFRKRLREAAIKPRGRSEAEVIKWSKMTPEQRKIQTTAAHDAVRGRKASLDELAFRAKSREGSMTYNVSDSEIILGNWLRELEIQFVHNFAVGPYNCDIGTGPVTVEVWGGGWHPKPIEVNRTKYILDSGYAMLIIVLDSRRFPISRCVTEYIISLLEITSGDPAAQRQYWMVRGDGELIFKRFNDYNISLIPPFTSCRNPANGQYERVPR